MIQGGSQPPIDPGRFAKLLGQVDQGIALSDLARQLASLAPHFLPLAAAAPDRGEAMSGFNSN